MLFYAVNATAQGRRIDTEVCAHNTERAVDLVRQQIPFARRITTQPCPSGQFITRYQLVKHYSDGSAVFVHNSDAYRAGSRQGIYFVSFDNERQILGFDAAHGYVTDLDGQLINHAETLIELARPYRDNWVAVARRDRAASVA